MTKIAATFPKINKMPQRVRIELLKRIFPNQILQKAYNSPLFQKHKSPRRKAEQFLKDCFTLVDNVYRGDASPHRFIHDHCRKSFVASLDEIKARGKNLSCPHCNDPSDLSQFVGAHDLQRFVLERSLGNAYLYANNTLGSMQDYYRFYCLIHRTEYQTKFSIFLRKAGKTNGCPECQRIQEIDSN